MKFGLLTGGVSSQTSPQQKTLRFLVHCSGFIIPGILSIGVFTLWFFLDLLQAKGQCGVWIFFFFFVQHCFNLQCYLHMLFLWAYIRFCERLSSRNLGRLLHFGYAAALWDQNKRSLIPVKCVGMKTCLSKVSLNGFLDSSITTIGLYKARRLKCSPFGN